MAQSTMQAQLSAGVLGGRSAIRPKRAACSRSSVCVKAAATGPGSREPKDMSRQMQQQCDAFFQVCTASVLCKHEPLPRSLAATYIYVA